ncbi:MAG: ATP-dependent protease [Synechococcus sp. SB0673_bin_10]|uniref:ATP-dependent protease n=1 Tax=Synechococcus sp. SB0676_bin_10 TaxID=2604869 RepID=A0A6B1FDU8_9SYNE|nr:LON peptidase substrate-binding domain-containing protein [Cyanobacteria bacterium MAG IRC4_bin_6]MXX09629.1 ATP-dependent protease [Synechococcus sp. SB0667_bin_8]MXY18484.1 ATP-dependent protease [Synechococcus sp. SB0664_bin_36]MXY63384.1 ATP-dependent protease [Synechococcus sp. SB0665_bin_28]MYF21126.1 ATP-dependent protease [Synechococcus sp. SB0677_bin_5]MYF36996.1 ATP-dependent protease [Synechococcus sp. SB0678_bin_12]MYG39143.1 ATP-dependent protease [Synechococcus sp. SB0676_bin
MAMTKPLAVRELPLFLLSGVVLFPREVLPLHIFEYRYRIMLKTVMEADQRFGVINCDPETGEPSTVGCCTEILQHHSMERDRSAIVTRGQQRFRVLNRVRDTPFCIGLVSWLEDGPPTADLTGLVRNVHSALGDVVKLSAKLSGKSFRLPEDIPLDPEEMSFWLASRLDNATAAQQHLLEITDTADRLQQEYALLDQARRQLAARTVLKDLEQGTKN